MGCRPLIVDILLYEQESKGFGWNMYSSIVSPYLKSVYVAVLNEERRELFVYEIMHMYLLEVVVLWNPFSN